jgi:nucleoid DNA-binding protein
MEVTMIEGKSKNLGRAYLVEKLRKLGLSRRDSVRILNIILDEMGKALKRGERVEFPLGALRRVRHLREKQRGWFLGKITTIYKKRRYWVRHEIDAEGDSLLNGKKQVYSAGSFPGAQAGRLLTSQALVTGQ